MVEVSNKHKSITVGVSSNNGNTIVTAKSDTAQYWSNQAHSFADQAKESVQEAKNYAELANSYIEGFEDVVTSNTNNIITTSNDCINQIAENTGSAIDSINSTKTTILNDIEFVADGEKQEINDLADVIKDNANTVNTAIKAGVERLNSIDALKNNQITNCILEIPQRIKLELNNGVLTLKAGSEVIVPNGFEEDGVTPKFDYVDIESDVSGLGWVTSTGMFLFRIGSSSLSFSDVSQITSGASATISGGNIWYDTTSNTVKRCDDGSTWRSGYSLPICLAKSSGSNLSGASTISSINQTFNGLGYIGSHKWLDKGVKLLCSNGRNEDGTLNNLEIVTEKLSLYTGGTDNVRYNNFYDVGLGYVARISQIKNTFVVNSLSELDDKAGAYVVAYVIPENKFYVHAANEPWEHFIGAQVGYHVNINSDGTVSEFTPYMPFRAVDYSDFNDLSNGVGSAKAYITETYVSGGSWYRVWSDGWKEQGGLATTQESDARYTSVTFLKPFSNANYTVVCSGLNAGMSNSDYGHVYSRTASSVRFNAAVSKTDIYWYACGY